MEFTGEKNIRASERTREGREDVGNVDTAALDLFFSLSLLYFFLVFPHDAAFLNASKEGEEK